MAGSAANEIGEGSSENRLPRMLSMNASLSRAGRSKSSTMSMKCFNSWHSLMGFIGTCSKVALPAGASTKAGCLRVWDRKLLVATSASWNVMFSAMAFAKLLTRPD